MMMRSTLMPINLAVSGSCDVARIASTNLRPVDEHVQKAPANDERDYRQKCGTLDR